MGVGIMNVNTSCRDPRELSKSGQMALALFLEECNKQGLQVLVTETYRSQERQNYLYEQGRSRPGKVVTWTKNSRHTSRRAWDICKNVKGQEYSDASFFKNCGIIAKHLGIIWGGEWQPQDTPHFEISSTWGPPKKKDELLQKAVSKIIASGININDTSWNELERINSNNVPALLSKLGGVSALVNKGVISSPTIWTSNTYKKEHVRALLIKYAATL